MPAAAGIANRVLHEVRNQRLQQAAVSCHWRAIAKLGAQVDLAALREQREIFDYFKGEGTRSTVSTTT